MHVFIESVVHRQLRELTPKCVLTDTVQMVRNIYRKHQDPHTFDSIGFQPKGPKIQE